MLLNTMAHHAGRFIGSAAIPLETQEEFRLGRDGILVDGEPAQLESWLAPYLDGDERCVRALVPMTVRPGQPQEIRIVREIPEFAPFEWHPDAAALTDCWLYFRVGERHVPVFGPGIQPKAILRQGPVASTARYFARVPDTQLWAEVDVTWASLAPYVKLRLSWGVDDPRFQAYAHDRSGLSESDTEIGFTLATNSRDPERARLQPLDPNSCVDSLTWEAPTWKWTWDRRQRNASGVILNDLIPWGCALHAQAVITFGRSREAQQWLETPHWPDSIADGWRTKYGPYMPWGEAPRAPQDHEHWPGMDRARAREKLRQECLGLRGMARDRYCQGFYAWNHQASLVIESLWHQTDGQTGGSHGYWHHNPCIGAVLYDVPEQASYVRQALQICPWPYTGYREINGDLVSCVDHPLMGSNRGQPAGQDRHGKPPPPSNAAMPLLIEPRSGGRLWGADSAHFCTAWPFAHAALFGDDGTRRIAESIAYGPVHLGNWNLDQAARGAVGEQRAFARGITQAAHAVWMFGCDDRLKDHLRDGMIEHRIKPAYLDTARDFPQDVVGSPYYLGPRREGQQRANLANHRFYRPWELAHAVGAYALGDLLDSPFLMGIAGKIADAVFAYGTPRIVDALTGRDTYTFLRTGIYEPGQAVAIVDGGARHLSEAEIQDNNWSRCSAINGQGECGDPPTNDGFMRLGVPGAGTTSFTTGLACLVQDGPLGDSAALMRYAEQGQIRMPSRPSDGTVLTWLDGLFRWNVGRADDVVVGPATRLGPMANGTKIAPDGSGRVWTVRPDGGVAVVLQETGTMHHQGAAPLISMLGASVAVTEAASASVIGLAVDYRPGRNYLYGLVSEASGYRLLSLDLASMTLVQSSALELPEPPVGISVTGSHGIIIATATKLLSLQDQLRELSLPGGDMVSMPIERINHVAASLDGNMLVLGDDSGRSHCYLRNQHTGIFGCPRSIEQIPGLVPVGLYRDLGMRLMFVRDGYLWSSPV